MLLIVDDEPTLLDLLSRYLGRLGHEVKTCGDAHEALALFQAEPDRFSMVRGALPLMLRAGSAGGSERRRQIGRPPRALVRAVEFRRLYRPAYGDATE